jgi:protein-disulfide isomerase
MVITVRRIFLLGLVLLAVWIAPAFSQSPDEIKGLRRDIDAVRDALKVIQNDLADIKKLVQQQPAAAPQPAAFQEATIKIDGAPFLGQKDAKVTLVEFSDYQCPFCGRNFQQTFPQVVSEYVKTGKIRYVFRDFPLESIHPLAFKASEAARCAGEQGKYWEMHDKLFSNQTALAVDNLKEYAKTSGVDVEKFKSCLESGKEAAGIRADIAEGQQIGARGTPGFFLGLTQPNAATFKAVKFINGAQPYAEFKAAIEGLLGTTSK